jgi:hypothetical protein
MSGKLTQIPFQRFDFFFETSGHQLAIDAISPRAYPS